MIAYLRRGHRSAHAFTPDSPRSLCGHAVRSVCSAAPDGWERCGLCERHLRRHDQGKAFRFANKRAAEAGTGRVENLARSYLAVVELIKGVDERIAAAMEET